MMQRYNNYSNSNSKRKYTPKKRYSKKYPQKTSFPMYKTPKKEIKTVDQPYQGQVMSTTATFTCLNLPVNGAAFYNRIGNQISGKSVRLYGQVIPSGNTTAGVPEYCRAMLVYDRQPNGAFPVIADILTDNASNGTTTTRVTSNPNMANSERFKILRDWKYAIPNNTTTGSDPQIYDYKGDYKFDEYVKLKGMDTKFKASAGSIGDIATGALYLVTYGDQTSSTAGYIFMFNTRYRFYDC